MSSSAPAVVHFERLTPWTPCGLARWRFKDGFLARSTDRAKVTCRRCRAFLVRWPDAV